MGICGLPNMSTLCPGVWDRISMRFPGFSSYLYNCNESVIHASSEYFEVLIKAIKYVEALLLAR